MTIPTPTRIASPSGRAACLLLGAIVILLGGCSAAPRNLATVDAYYRYDFTDARETLRREAQQATDEQAILNALRLGAAALADGDLREAERELHRTFDWLSTAGLNRDRTTAAVLVHEGVRIWKGEPFEQALAYTTIATSYAVAGDWENCRAAAANALFRLRDFGADQPDKVALARRAVSDDTYLDEGYTAIDSNFALGFLLQGMAADVSGAAGASEQLDAVTTINPALAPLVDVVRRRAYDTVLIVDWGKGPTKVAYGEDRALSRFEPQDRAPGLLSVTAGHTTFGSFPAACDVNALASDLRWNNLEDVRVFKSMLGTGMQIGGAVVLGSIDGHDSGDQKRDKAIVGLGLLALGQLLRSGARADTRYFEFAPQSVFVAPLRLERTTDLRITAGGTTAILDRVEPGRPGNPRAIYLRLHGPDSPRPSWLTAPDARYGNDHTGVRPGDYPWILGGRDVSTPTREVLAAYQAGGWLTDLTIADLQRLYEIEGIRLGSGMNDQPGQINRSFRHVLEGGTGLFTPEPSSLGYARVMRTEHPPYVAKSPDVRDLAARIAAGRATLAAWPGEN